MIHEICQFRFVDGSEIIAEVMEWDDNNLIVKNAMTILLAQQDGERFYILKPWNSYVDTDNHFINVNVEHILSSNNAHKFLIEEYIDARNQMHEMTDERQAQYEEEVNEQIERVKKSMKKSLNKEEDDNNVVAFKMKDDTTIH